MAPPVYHYERVASTMDVIHALAEQGAEAGTIVIAGEQLQGRGSRGRPWHSPPGGLWMSALFRPPAAGGVEVVSLRVGLAVAPVLDPFASTTVRLKWPNDLMVGERKLGGILCEARWQGDVLGWLAVGLGLNLRNSIPAELRAQATSLTDEQALVDDEKLVDAIIAAIGNLDFRPARLSPAELDQFAARNWLSGREIRGPVCGTVTGLGNDATLQVRTAEGSSVALRNASIELAAVSHTT
jgi:BirA family biotin operon repressor/biotin-[acetyl-CoA-carboxylase] ligase